MAPFLENKIHFRTRYHIFTWNFGRILWYSRVLCLCELIVYSYCPPACCHLFVVGGLCASVTQIAMLAGVFILLVGSPKPDRLKD